MSAGSIFGLQEDDTISSKSPAMNRGSFSELGTGLSSASNPAGVSASRTTLAGCSVLVSAANVTDTFAPPTLSTSDAAFSGSYAYGYS